jgi:hypothetical protein
MRLASFQPRTGGPAERRGERAADNVGIGIEPAVQPLLDAGAEGAIPNRENVRQAGLAAIIDEHTIPTES